MKDIIEDDKNALYDKVKDNSFNFQNQLNMKDDSTDTKNEAIQHYSVQRMPVTLVIGNRDNVIEHFCDEGH